MNTNMKELSFEEMELVNGGSNTELNVKETTTTVGMGAAGGAVAGAAVGSIVPVVGTAAGAAIGAAVGAAVAGGIAFINYFFD